MGLQGEGGERGYAMAALLVSIAVMAVLMSVAMPAYRHLARREKEAELVFRGEQYARAIALFRAKNGNTFPPSIDVLVQGKYLRKKYRDPMSADGEFKIVPVGNPTGQNPGQNPGGGRGPNPPQGGRGGNPPQGPSGGNPQTGGPGQTGAVSGGMMGVASTSTETSIRTYKGQTRYDLWPFTFNMVNRPGGNMPGANAPGGGDGRPQPGGPGRGVGPGRGTGPGRGGPGGGRGPGRGGPGMGAPGGQGPGRGMVPDFGGRRGGGN